MLKKILKEHYILASKSPRRKALLNQIGLKFSVEHSDIEEVENDSNPIRTVEVNSYNKAMALSGRKDKIIIGADTIVVINGDVLHKPKNSKDAERFLRMLSGRTHKVYTGVTIINNKTGKKITGYELTYVTFRKLDDEEIKYYVKFYKPLDKAGAYGIQDDFGALFIESIKGDYYNVVGLPLVRTYELIKKTF